MRVIPSILALALVAATPLHAMHRGMTQEDLDYPGTIAIATGHGEVDVRVIYQAQEDCWRIKSAREGVPNRMTDQPSERHLYVTVDIEKTAATCQPKHNEITTRLTAALPVIEAAGARALGYFRQPLDVENKLGTGFDPVTIADREVEALIRERLLALWPDSPVEGEEAGLTPGDSPWSWIAVT